MTATSHHPQSGDLVRLKERVVSGQAIVSFANAGSTVVPEASIETAEPPQASKSGTLEIGAGLVRWHYSRLLDRRVLHPMLSAQTREAALEIMGAEWSWFLGTCGTMSQLFFDATPETDRVAAREASAREVRSGALLAGDVNGEEIAFLQATFESARAIAVSFGSMRSPSSLAEDSDLRSGYMGCCQFYGLGRLLLRVAGTYDSRTKAGVSLAIELMRFGAVHGYAAVRAAWELRREPEQQTDLLPVSDSDYRLALSS